MGNLLSKLFRAKSSLSAEKRTSAQGFKIKTKSRKLFSRFLAIKSNLELNVSDVKTAAGLILANKNKLLRGEKVEKCGFCIQSGYTGRFHPGKNSLLTLKVSFRGKLFFVKLSKGSVRMQFNGFEKASEIFKKHNNEMFGFKVKMLPFHLFYEKEMGSNKNKTNFIVSDFVSEDKVAHVGDIELLSGESKFRKTKLGIAINKIRVELAKSGVKDAGAFNCFIDKESNTLYYFDLISV